jgi:hypothetical protein
MRKSFWVILAIMSALLLTPKLASADSLTGSVGVTWLYPNTSTPITTTGVVAVGSVLMCPSAASFCSVPDTVLDASPGSFWSFDVVLALPQASGGVTFGFIPI